MPWIPENPILGPIEERDAFSFSISYEDEFGASGDPVTITTTTPFTGVTVVDNNISGTYIDAFDQQVIKYRTIQDTFVEVQKWADIDTTELWGVYHFIQDPRDFVDFEFIATSGSETQTYSVRINNSLDYDKRQLAKYVNPAGIIVTWTNASGQTVSWINSNNETIEWTT